MGWVEVGLAASTICHYLIDMTGEPTGIRLMLPARTRLVENAAFERPASPAAPATAHGSVEVRSSRSSATRSSPARIVERVDSYPGRVPKRSSMGPANGA